MRLRILLLLAWLSVAGNAAAQWSYSVELNSAYDSNPLGINETPASNVSSLEAGLEYGAGLLGVGYTGGYTTYSNLANYDHYFHQAYVGFGTDTTSVGLQFEQRLPTRDQTYAYYRVGGYGQHRIGLGPANLTLQAYGSYYEFRELMERNQVLVGGMARLVRWFQTGTSITGDLGFQHTRYPDLGDLTTDLGTGKGRGQGGSLQTPAVSRVSWGLRVAQSLDEVTGLALQYRQQVLDGNALEQVARPSGVSYAIIDDPSIYAARTFGAELTRLMGDRQIMMKLGAYTVRRDYAAQGTYLDDGTYDADVRRRDTYRTLWLMTNWTPQLAFLGDHQVSLQLNAQWTDNKSNSYWYQYGNEFISLGLLYSY